MAIPLDQVMATAIASAVPSTVDPGELVVVDEQAHATTRTKELQAATLKALEDAMSTASTTAQRARLQHAFVKFGASLRLRQIAADPQKLGQLEAAAANGDPNAVASLQGIAVMRLSDLKDTARAIAQNAQRGDPNAWMHQQTIAQTAATPGHPQQSEAIALQSMIAQAVKSTPAGPQMGATVPQSPPSPPIPPAAAPAPTSPLPNVIPVAQPPVSTAQTVTPGTTPVVPGGPGVPIPSLTPTDPKGPPPTPRPTPPAAEIPPATLATQPSGGACAIAPGTPCPPSAPLPCDPTSAIDIASLLALSELERAMGEPHAHGFPFTPGSGC
jgi:hypothetical protein